MKNYNTIVIAGGGMKGFTMLGTLQFLYQQNILQNIKKYIGTSIGSTLSLLMVLEFEPSEIILFMIQSQELKKFTTYNIIDGIHGRGFVDFENFNMIVKHLISKKLDFIPTFQQLYEKYPIELSMITFNYSLNKE